MVSMLGRLGDRLLSLVAPHTVADAAVGFCGPEVLICTTAWCNSYVKRGQYVRKCCRNGSCRVVVTRTGCYCS